MIPTRDYGQSGSESRELRTVVIDPGHGGSDPGAVAGESRKKTWSLLLVFAWAIRLRKTIPTSR